MSLSVTIICVNEAARIAACLESVRFADEIVVCDSGSTDGTLDICRRFTDKVFTDPWRGFSGHKNLALERATAEWILSLDADERVPPALAEEIRRTMADPGAKAGYMLARRNYFSGIWIRHGGWYPDRTVRLFRRGRGRFLPRAVHEAVSLDGETGELTEPLEHYTYDSLSAYLTRMDRYSTLAAEEMRAVGRRARIRDLAFRPPATFLRMFLLQRGFRDGLPGFILAGLYAAQTLAKYAKLWEQQVRGLSEPGASPAHALGSSAVAPPPPTVPANGGFASVPAQFLRERTPSPAEIEANVRANQASPYFRFGHVLLPAATMPGEGLLDLGGGSGGWAAYARTLGWDVTVVDASPERLACAEALGIAVMRHDLNCPLPLPAASVGAVVMTEVLEHIPMAERLLAETARVLRPGGVVVLTTPNNAHYRRRIRALQGRSPDDEGVHFRFPVKKKLTRMVETAGFRVRARNSYGALPLLDRLLLRRWRGHARRLFVVPPALEALLADRFVWLLERTTAAAGAQEA